MLKDLTKCTGCAACVQRCPQNCIEMRSDKDGFLYPQIVSKDMCIDCGICDDVCPQNNDSGLMYPQEVYIAIYKDKIVREQSSSGGIFVALAEEIIHQGGAVYGCAINSSGEVYHKRIDKCSEIIELQGSKYAQSSIGSTYLEVKNDLKKGNTVLFSGLPCQIDGLKKFIGKEYNNLFCVDLICHGVPSVKFEKLDLKYWNRDQEIKYIKFRDKKGNYKTRFRFNIMYTDGKKKIIPSKKSLYYDMFIKNMNFRRSCYGCRYKIDSRVGDITLGDCATADFYKFHNNKACSTVLINTCRGSKLWEKCSKSVDFQKIDYLEEAERNSALNKCKASMELKLLPHRNELYDCINNMKYHDVMEKYIKSDICLSVKDFIKSCVPVNLKSFYHHIKRG